MIATAFVAVFGSCRVNARGFAVPRKEFLNKCRPRGRYAAIPQVCARSRTTRLARDRKRYARNKEDSTAPGIVHHALSAGDLAWCAAEAHRSRGGCEYYRGTIQQLYLGANNWDQKIIFRAHRSPLDFAIKNSISKLGARRRR